MGPNFTIEMYGKNSTKSVLEPVVSTYFLTSALLLPVPKAIAPAGLHAPPQPWQEQGCVPPYNLECTGGP